MRLTPLRSLGVAAVLALTAVACSASGDDSDSSAADISDAKACPDGLVDVVKHDNDWHLFSPKVADACLVDAQKQPAVANQSSADLEKYLSSHPFVSLSKKPDFLATCMASSSESLEETQKRAVVGNYYYLMNALKQDNLATMESLAGVNMLLGNEPLPAVEGFTYSHPYLHESSDWERRLKANCHNDKSKTEALVQFTNGVLWQTRKISAAIYEARIREQAFMGDLSPEAQERRKAIDTLVQQRNVLTQSIAPWLSGREMSGLIEWETDLETMVQLENTFDLVDETGMTRLKEFWKDKGKDPKNPMVKQEAQVREAFLKQLAATRDTLVTHMKDLQKAADFLHKNEDGKISTSEYQEIMGKVAPFNPDVFTNYYKSDDFKKRFSEEQLTALEKDVQSSLPAGTPWPNAENDSAQRLLRLEVVAQNAAVNDDLKGRVAKMRATFDEALGGAKAASALGEAKCRNEKRSDYAWRDDLAWQLGIAAGLTVVTFGMGWWLSAARVAVIAGEAATTGLEWAQNARVSVLAARGAMGLARSGVTYQNQARLLWGVLLGANGYFTVDGVQAAITGCNEAINDSMLKMFDQPYDEGSVMCLEGKDAMSHQAVANYKACAVNIVMTGALSLISVYAGVHDIRHGPLGAR